jgi:hypothetical protein
MEPTTRVLLPSSAPDYVGAHGKAWRFDLDAVHRACVRDGAAPPRELQVCGWAAHAPYSHPIWPCVMVCCISLRDAPGWPPAVVNMPGATHEVMVIALDPAHEVQLDDRPRYLSPLNFFTGQFIAASDDEARERVDQAVRDICDGTLNPDSDNRRAWGERFSRSNIKPGFDDPDFIVAGPGGIVAVGTGAAQVKLLDEIVKTSATLGADESKPQ